MLKQDLSQFQVWEDQYEREIKENMEKWINLWENKDFRIIREDITESDRWNKMLIKLGFIK